MAKNAYIGVGGVARKVKGMYIGVNGVARKVKKGYIEVNGAARLFYSGANIRVTIFGADQYKYITYSGHDYISNTTFNVSGGDTIIFHVTTGNMVVIFENGVQGAVGYKPFEYSWTVPSNVVSVSIAYSGYGSPFRIDITTRT